MCNTLEALLYDLALSEKWIMANIVDKVFVEKWHVKLPSIDAEHIRIQFFST